MEHKPSVAGWRRRQEEASPWSREYRPRSGQARSSVSCWPKGVAEGDARSELIKLAVLKIVEEALEAEVAEAVSRGTTRAARPRGPAIATGIVAGACARPEGAIEYGVPQVADRAEPFVSRVWAGLAGRTAELERLAVEMYARG